MKTASTVTGGANQADLSLYKVGGVAGVLAAVLGVAANALHPRPAPDDLGDVGALVDLVAGYPLWRMDHLAIIFAAMLGAISFVAVARSISQTPGAPWARMALFLGVASIGVSLASFSLDGLALSAVADGLSEGVSREVVVERMTLVLALDLPLFATTVVSLFGVTSILFGMALIKSGIYPTWAGAAGVLGGVIGFTSGVWMWIDGSLGFGNFLILFTISTLLFTIWTFVASLRLLRLAGGSS